VTAVRIHVADDDVWRLTLDALAASCDVPAALTIRCATCRRTIGYAGDVPNYGPLFTASWQVPAPSPATVNGRPMNERQRHRFEDHNPSLDVDQTGEPVTDETHGTIALLRLPAGYPEEYPTLLVRCARHGDAVLDRGEVLGALHDGHRETLAPATRPLTSYVPPRRDFGSVGRQEHVKRTVTFRPRPSTT
jgi:hypothetical protein